MKQITQERLTKAKDKIFEYFARTPECKIMNVLSQVGFRGFCYDFCGETNRDAMTERDRLELAYLEFGKQVGLDTNSQLTPEKIELIHKEWQRSWQLLLDKKFSRDAKIYKIQHKYGVSGLEESEVDFGHGKLKFQIPHQRLELLEEDYKIMQAERMKIAEYFLEAQKFNNMRLYRRTTDLDDRDDWIETSPELVLNLTSSYQWANVWDSKTYIDRYELETRGQTRNKRFPESDRDELVWEINLSVGNGVPEISRDSTWFCANIGTKKPFL